MRQEGILLRLVEAVHFVDEKHRRSTLAMQGFCPIDCRPDLLHAREHGRELDELRPGVMGEHLGKRRLASAGRTPENHGVKAVVLDRLPQRSSLADNRLLSDKFLECAGAHPVSERAESLFDAREEISAPRHRTPVAP